MLNNDKYFNQSIITSENIQNRLSQFIEGLDIITIVELINKDIEQNHPNDETFVGNIETQDYKIKYERDFIQWNALFVCDKWAKMKYSKIIIAQGDLVLILAGDDTNRLQARRKTQNQEITLKVSLNKDGTMDIEEQENISERINPKKTRTLER
jgi:hypothetical protein